MSKKQVWFSLPAEYSPDGSGTGSETGPAFSWHEFSSLRESSKVTEGSDLSQYNSPPRSSLSGQELSQYSLRPSMEANPNSETVSTNESQDISTSQQESTMSDGQYGYDDANSTSSIHDSPHEEAVSSAIMEVSGELMLGKFSPHGNRSGGSESSELSDDDVRRPSSGGAIAKYPESSTGLSDNDWNPYATESDTNQTPRSPRSTASDEQNRVGFVSKATFSIAQPKDSTTTVSMTTGEVTVGDTKPERVVLSDSDGRVSDNLGLNGRSGAERLDILRYVMDNDEKQRTEREKDIARKEIRSPEDDLKRESPDTARSGYTEGSRSGRVSTESGQSLDTLRRESSESARSFHSGRQSAESGLSGRSSRSDLDRSGESIFSGRQSAESQHSAQSGRSRASQRSSARSVGSDRSERLDRLSDAAGDSLKELMQFESAQRAAPGFEKKQTTEMEETSTRVNRDGSGDSVVRTRLTARLEPYTSPVRSSKSPEPSSNVASSNGYISVAERERLLSDSPDVSQEIGRPKEERRETKYDRTPDAGLERNKPSHSNTNLPRFSESLPDRSPSDISMKRVASLFEETKRQVREAVAIPRPEPSGSEERFPLRERLTWSAHEDSFKSYEKDELAEKSERKMEKPRDPEVVRSLTSEEVARVLGKYSEDDTSRSAKTADKLDKTKADDAILVSAFDKVDDNHAEVNDDIQRRSIRTHDVLDGLRSEEVSDDEISKRVKALLSETDHLGILRENGTNGRGHEYIPRTIDYSRLQKDLQEIQDSLHDVPPPVANDSIHVQRKNLREGYSGQAEDSLKDEPRSLSTTCTTTGGRESGVSEYGRRLVWDHGADLEYDEGYGGQFIGTMTTTDTLSTKLRGSSDTDTLVVRPDSAATNDTDYDAAELEGTKTLTGSDITRAEKLVEQVMNRRAEGDLKESVEDIIARYRNERKDLFDRLQAPPVPKVVKDVNEVELEYTKPAAKAERPILKDPDVALPDPQQKGTQNQQMNGTKQPGLAERVYKILTSEEGEVDNFHNPEEKGMAKKVYKILANDRPQEQVNGILTETMANEHEMLQKLVAKPKDDSSLDDSGLNGTSESFDIEDKDIRKQLEYSLFSSPGKGEKSDFTALREVTSAPYSALSNAKSLLSTQMKKMSERNFDKSIELRTPYRQAIDCYPVYGVERLVQKETEPREAWMPARRSTERSGQQDVEPREAPIPARRSAERSGQEEAEHGEPREAWMPTRRSADTSRSGDRNKALASDRFYLTDKDRTKRDFDGTQQRTRTFSDPFEVSPGRMAAGSDRFRGEGHTRSRSEEAGNVSDLSQYSFVEPQYSPTERRMAQSPRSLRPATLGTPQHHRPQDNDKVVKKLDDRITNKQKDMKRDSSPSPTESDTSGSRKGAKLRPYRPAGTRDVYYTESGEDNNESGTTLESSHPGSDDAAPPYIPSQFLGSRRDEPVKHPIGIYGNKEKDALSTIDENSVKDEKEKALSASGGSGKQGAGSDKHSTVTADTGYQTATMRSRSPASLKDDHEPNSNGHNAGGLDRPGFKTREEYQRDFERRERELKELLSKRNPVETQRDSLGTSTRSDPGEVLNDPGSRWEYRQSDQMNEFHRLEPEPAYPEDRLRYSRSKSDTDLVALTPDESQRYSSPMQPGVRFLEFSTQHSPIFAHHDSITYQTRGVPGGVPADLPRVPIEREQGQAQLAQELPRVYDRRPVVTAPELPRSDERRVTPTNTTDYPVRPLEPVEPPVQPLEPGSRSHVPRAADALGPVDLGADPRKMGNMRRTVTDTDRAKSPLNVRQKEMEVELEKLNKQLSDQVNEIQEKRTDENFEDNFPPSKKAQALREVLEQEYMDNLPPNINDMWTRFKERKEQSVSESSLNSTRLDALSGLLQNPTHHDVNSFVREKKELTEKHKMEEREKGEKFHEEKLKEKELERKAAAEKAAQLRNFRRQEMKNRHGLSEEESNGSYSEILIENERKREERRKKDETRRERRERKEGRAKSPSKKVSEPSVEERRKDRSRKTKDEGSVTDIRARNGSNRHSDTMDTLFSIPEDASFEQSPTKAESQMRSRQRRQRHVIDPLMKKLRDKIKMQRDKIDKERRKELQRVEKLKKLEMLLNAKTKGKLSDKAIDVELCDVSSTTSVSRTESSRMSDSTLAGLSTAVESDVSSHGSTTLKDSTIDSAIKLQVKRYPAEEYRKTHYVDSDTPESSDFSNIVVERVPERKSERKNKERKSSSKGKKTKVDEFGNKIRKEKKDKRRKDVFGVEFTEKDIAKQIKRYENYMTPERERLMRVENYLSPQRQGRMRDASTMYPSPVTVSPPSRRRRREVLMKSEAIQTSPALRSSSPSHAYDEVPVAPVPYMSRKSGKTSRRRTSPSPTRSAQTSFSASPPRKTSRSPSARKTSTSPASRRRFSPPITRRQAQSPIWKPESETTPPHNSMFTPEGDENTAPDTKQKREAESWFIPMKPSQPWRQPLKERQAFSVRQEAWEPKSVSQSTWKDIIHGDILKDKGDPNDISRDTKFDLDPEGQPVGEDETFTDSEEEADISRSKPLSKMSLQEAFQARRGNIISRLRERQKRLNLAAEQRKMEVFLQMERDRLFQEERKKEANPDAHPYSDNLHKPTRRVISKEEMKEMTKKRYKKLPEVIEQQKMKKRQDEYSLNRVKARLFNRKIQKKILVKAEKWGR
ncbi:uncharacterized protein LOC123546728 isoform X6 [Mercenaria mercenaria]|uniref:uncharacterized protein LOC123546728 isoform X6 n=1 Tax=Mercenaria mercenaria TaxID=6596 RepID=UPI00234F92DF|nr:uncharacterized protein LOC123546728 isoform X6 [Mercenaria mercenaria]